MERPKAPIRRCAIYTRKSSEEGLEQDFNSLHAQREACEAFIKSQAGEGWRLVKIRHPVTEVGWLRRGGFLIGGVDQLAEKHLSIIDAAS
jgi:hypothetical protein